MLLCGGCDFYYYKLPSPDDLWHIIPWFDHMITARYIRPYQTAAVPRYTPVGTVPVTGGEPDWSAEWTGGKTTTADSLRSPYAQSGNAGASPAGPAVPVIPREVEAAGDTLYQNFCTVCHGAAGDAQGAGLQSHRRAVAAHRPARGATATATSTASSATGAV